MFETAELGRKISKSDYEKQLPALRTELLRVQNELVQDPKFSVVIVIAGVDGAGKGETVNILHEWMDPRYLEAHAYGLPSDEESERPPMWRFWRMLPPKGRVGMFFGSWYTAPIVDRVMGRSTNVDLASALSRINHFEKGLVDDGTLVLKYWFHLSKKAQKKRLGRLSKDRRTSWRVTKQDWKNFARYDDFMTVCEDALRETSTGEAPWLVVEGADKHYRELTVARHILDAIVHRRAAEADRAPRKRKKVAPAVVSTQPTILSTLDLSRKLAIDEYRRELVRWQGKLNKIMRKRSLSGQTSLLVFEGADAAGKGGAIRRVTRALDARYYKVVPIAAPTDEEAARHYLWRFWRHLPRAGRLIVFDRSWYGRVLVERVEGYARDDEWRRAYKEINEFEAELCAHGVGLVKFWLHVDPDEQLRRFQEREKTSYKQYKITAEDYRNRERWDLYTEAVNEMVERTSTSFAPWKLISAQDKRLARVEVLRTIVERLTVGENRRKDR